ncbi:MAG: L-2-amino-thiazoline-4-carboxylic acid hydrolase, partial [Alphaproteobacteria bacterium]|nr:L-2-amino-thiazoline-4-carboxylic acid hydrolase [Alphaproteobacteria bacterium]
AEFAAQVGGKTSMRSFIERQAQWRLGDALTVEVKEESDTSYVYNVTRCRYAEMYREMGLGEIGHLLSCQRDATFCEGYDTRLKLTRTQTIMQGASHCDFNYKLARDATSG